MLGKLRSTPFWADNPRSQLRVGSRPHDLLVLLIQLLAKLLPILGIF